MEIRPKLPNKDSPLELVMSEQPQKYLIPNMKVIPPSELARLTEQAEQRGIPVLIVREPAPELARRIREMVIEQQLQPTWHVENVIAEMLKQFLHEHGGAT